MNLLVVIPYLIIGVLTVLSALAAVKANIRKKEDKDWVAITILFVFSLILPGMWPIVTILYSLIILLITFATYKGWWRPVVLIAALIWWGSLGGFNIQMFWTR